MSETESTPESSGRHRLTVALAIAGGLYLLLGFVVVPFVAKDQIIRLLEEQTGVVPTLERLRFNPLTLRATAEGFSLPDANPERPDPAISFDQLSVSLRPFGFFSADVPLGPVRLVAPAIFLVEEDSGSLNLVELFAGDGGAEDEPEIEDAPGDDAAPLVVDVESITIEAGHVQYREPARERAFAVNLRPIELRVERFTTRVGEHATYSLDLAVEEGAALRWEGTLALAPLESEGHLAIASLRLGLVSKYLAESLRFEVPSGLLGIEGDYRLALGDDRFEVGFDSTSLTIEALEIHPRSGVDDPTPDVQSAESGTRGEARASSERAPSEKVEGVEVIGLPRVAVSGVSGRVSQQGLAALEIGEVALDGGRLALRIDPDGSLPLARLFDPIPVENADVSEVADAPAVGAESVPPPEIHVGRFVARELEIAVEDRSAAAPVSLRLAPFDLEIRDYRSAPGSRLSLDLETGVGESGRVSLEGPIQVEPLDATIDVEIERVDLAELEPYLDPVAKLDLRRGSLSAVLEVRLAERAGSVEPAVKGRIQLDRLSAFDYRLAKELLSLDAIRLEGFDLDAQRVHLDEVVISGANAQFVLQADGGSNVEAILAQSDPAEGGAAAEKESASTAAPARAVSIGQVRLEKVAARFLDLGHDPAFTTEIEGLEGTIDGLSSDEASRARVAIEGIIDGVAPVRISGELNPLRREPASDIQIEVDHVPLPEFSAYSGRYVGYRIDRGDLSLRLDYEVEDRRLAAENRITLSRFAFGKKVESPQATTLPVPLALALMRDSKGDIVIDFPLRGNLDDPSFDLMSLLGKTFVTLITKVAASPFSIVSGLTGLSSNDLSRVVFEPGSEEISAEAQSHLSTLAEALEKKADLRIEIRGQADPTVDGGTRDSGEAGLPEADARALARARAKAVRAALLATEAIQPGRVGLADVVVGAVADEQGVPTQLSLTVR